MKPAVERLGLTVPEAALLALAVLVSLFTGFYAIDAESMWADEGVSIREISLPLPDYLAAIFGDKAYSALYYILLRLATTVAGMGEAAIRAPSALFVAAAVPFVYLVARAASGRIAGLFAVLLAVSSAFLVHYSQEARAYALAYLLVAVSSWLLVRAVNAPETRRWVLYGVVAALAAYAHFFAVFVIVAQVGWALVALPAQRRHVLVVAAAGGLALVPLGLNILAGKERGWIENVSPERVEKVVGALVGADLVPQDPRLLAVAFAGGVVLALVAALAPRPRTAGLARPSGPGGRSLILLLAACVAVPVGGSLLVSLVKPILVPRYLIVVEPALLALVGVGYAWLRPRWVGPVVIAATVVIGAMGVSTWYRVTTKTDFRAAAGIIQANAGPNDLAIVFPPGYEYAALDYYLQRPSASGGQARAVSAVRGREAPGMLATLDERPRIWLVVVDVKRLQPGGRELWLDALRSGRVQISEQTLPDFTLYLFQAAPPTAIP